jgi:uncharacterized membrane protein
MKAERGRGGEKETRRLGDKEMGSEDDLELSEEEKLVMNLLKEKSPVDLNELKGQTGLSGKKWDKAIKGLTKNELAKVEKKDEGFFLSLDCPIFSSIY